MLHDRIASVMSLARTVRGGLDMGKLETPVQTHTLALLLDTLIELGTPTHHQKSQDGATRSVMSMVTAVSEAERSRG